jgi:hypothetical protein
MGVRDSPAHPVQLTNDQGAQKKTFCKTICDVRKNTDAFSIVIQKMLIGLWDFSDPQINKNRSGDPEIVALEDEIVKSIHYGAQFIADNYDCAISSPKGTID